MKVMGKRYLNVSEGMYMVHKDLMQSEWTNTGAKKIWMRDNNNTNQMQILRFQ